MQEFNLTLKNDKLKLYNRLNLFIIIALTFLYIYFGFFAQKNTTNLFTKFTLALMVLVLVIWGYFQNTKDKKYFEVYIFSLVLGWIWLKLYWLAGATFLLGILFSYASKRKIVFFSASDIVYPSFPLKKINWGKLNNCLLKDGLLTIDFKNNKIIQQAIDESKTSVNEKEFNDFCQQQLNK
jgi:hypothetical protein